MRKIDIRYLEMTIELAKKAEGDTSPNPLVGCIIVKNNKIISKGYHHRCGTAHAEVEALKKAGKKAQKADLYVNLEPCAHHGRTAPCVEAIIKSKIKKVFIGMKDPNPLTNGKGIAALKKAGIEVEISEDQQPFKKLNEIFIKYITTGHPFIAVKSAQSLDGRIATKNHDSKWITNKQSRAYAQYLRKKYDAVLVGVNTVLIDNPYLSCRYDEKLEEDSPVKVIVDSTLKTPVHANIFSGLSPAPVIIATTKKAPLKKLKEFENCDADIIMCPLTKDKKVDIEYLVCELAKNEITSILVEGGGEINGAFFDLKIVDKVYFFIAPKIIGGSKAVSSVMGEGVTDLKNAVGVIDPLFINFEDDILVEGNISYK
jgi:diaminohydroxyphosphoribosylaminopyrimidine deaminase/5-amino-6-(5-phosphoribosylamino)uracil reductase